MPDSISGGGESGPVSLRSSELAGHDQGKRRTDPDPDRSPIFVVGTGRSGTTLLRMMLNAHPHIHLTHEASYYRMSEGIPKIDAVAWLRRYFTSPLFAFMNLPPRAVFAQLHHPEKASIPEAYAAVMRAKARQYDKPRYGDKTPMHLLHLRQIFGDYIEPKIIHVVRDPRATVASMLRMPWGASSPALNSYVYSSLIRKVCPFAGRIHELRLEDLVSEPERTMREVLAFLNEPWSDTVLDHERHAPTDDLPQFPWFENATRNTHTSSGQPAWKNQLSPAWIRIVENMNRYAMKRYGYERSELERAPGIFERFWVRVKDIPEVARSMSRMSKLIKYKGRMTLPPAEVLAEALLNVNPAAWKYYPDFVMPDIPEVDLAALDKNP